MSVGCGSAWWWWRVAKAHSSEGEGGGGRVSNRGLQLGCVECVQHMCSRLVCSQEWRPEDVE